MNNQLSSTNEVLALTSAQSAKQSANYITDVDVVNSAREHYYCWLSRFVAFIAMLSLMFFTSASLVLFNLTSEVHVEPFLVIRQSNSEEMVRYETISQNMPSSRQIMELFIRQYVIIRNSIVGDAREMQSRWLGGGMINYLSSDKIFSEFATTVEKNLAKATETQTVRDVEIISIGKVGGEKSPVWKVDFKTYDLSPQNRNETTGEFVLQTKYWTVSIVAVFVPERMFMSKRLMNPLGFTVTRYSQTEVEIL